MDQAKKIFENLEGQWTLYREINNLKDGTVFVAKGEASFIALDDANPNSLHYKESGILHLPDSDKVLSFSRKYIYQLKDGAIHIILDDGVTKGNIFQILIPGEDDNSFTGTEHLCVADLYNGSYHFKNEHTFLIEYTVKGPNKNMKFNTKFQKLEV